MNTTAVTHTAVLFDEVQVGDVIAWDVTDRGHDWIEIRTVSSTVTAVTANTVRCGTSRLTRSGWYRSNVRRQNKGA